MPGTPLEDIKDKRFGSLVARTIVGSARVGKKHPTTVAIWKCECDCGNFKLVRRGNLIQYKTKHCGCKYSLVPLLKKKNIKPEDTHKWVQAGGRAVDLPKRLFDAYRNWKFRVWLKTPHGKLHLARRKNPNDYNPERAKLGAKNNRRRRRLEVVEILGGKCSCCGEAHIEFLAVDHVGGDGAAERDIGQHAAFTRIINSGKADPAYRLLCHNCNIAIDKYGECPHVREKKTARDNNARPARSRKRSKD